MKNDLVAPFVWTAKSFFGVARELLGLVSTSHGRGANCNGFDW